MACVCTGLRYCAECHEDRTGLRFPLRSRPEAIRRGTFKDDWIDFDDGSQVRAQDIGFTGLFVLADLISLEEEELALDESKSFPWILSQSGRRKTDFCPVKANFKKKKIGPRAFTGFPRTVLKFLERARERCEKIQDFRPVEVFYQEYKAERLANFDFHIDDTWAWGERIVDINMQGDSTIAFYRESDGTMINVPFPRRTCIILSGAIRYEWEHGIQENSFRDARMSITVRELGPELAESDDGARLLTEIEEMPPI